MAWTIGVDVGGTFTDLVAWEASERALVRAKVPTVSSDPVQGVSAALSAAFLDVAKAERLIHGSTIAINAVLQGTGARTALITTRGFRDVLEMGRKNRPDMYNLFFQPRLCPVPRQMRLEVGERLLWTGEVMRDLDASELADAISTLPEDVEAVAVCFLHSYSNPVHEHAAQAAVRAARPAAYVTASADLSREVREYERTSTAVVNAYVGPLVATYLGSLQRELSDRGYSNPLLITQSNGGVMPAAVALQQPVRTMESGPAAGVTGTAWLGATLGADDLIAFDMGGTSAKACVIEDGEPEAASEYYVGGRTRGLPVQIPFLEIAEVGAGGGSIAYVDAGGALRVGPQSAGADPGPAAYDRGGMKPTITDANVVAGRIAPDYFNGGAIPLSHGAALAAVGRLAAEAGLSVDECVDGILQIANAVMAGAIREVTVERGRDPRDFALVAYGGAGPLHAAELASQLEIPRVIVPAGAGTFAALGMLLTDLRHDVSRAFFRKVDELDIGEWERAYRALESDAAKYLEERLVAVAPDPVRHIRRADLRYAGQFHTLTMTIPSGLSSPEALAGLFHDAHLERYGHNAPSEPVEVQAIRVSASSAVPKPDLGAVHEPRTRRNLARSRRVLFDRWRDAVVLDRQHLEPGVEVTGPAVIEDPATNIVLGPRDRATVLPGGHVEIAVGVVA